VYARKQQMIGVGCIDRPLGWAIGSNSLQFYSLDCTSRTYTNVTKQIVRSVKFNTPFNLFGQNNTIQTIDLAKFPIVLDSTGEKYYYTKNESDINLFLYNKK
jgi:hypothetical protein